MTHEREESLSGVHRLSLAATGTEMALDRRQETLTFLLRTRAQGVAAPPPQNGHAAAQPAPLSIRLKRFDEFEADMNALDDARREAVMHELGRLAEGRDAPATRLWQDTLGDFAFLLLRYSRKHPLAFESVPQRSRDAGLRLLGWVGATDAKTAWRASFDPSLPIEHRYNLLRDAQQAFASGGAGTAQDGARRVDLAEIRDRESFWFSAMRRYEVALEWCRDYGYRSLEARQALRDSATAYLQVLKDEPRRRDLARLLSEFGTDLEAQVKKVLFPEAGVPGGDFSRDEVLHRTFIVWFLRRYDLVTAWKLILRTPPAGEKVRAAIWTLVILCLLSMLLFLLQFTPAPALTSFYTPPQLAAGPVWFVQSYAPWLWALQVLLQLAALAATLILAPTFFRLLMPRALFGSLLAWATIVLTTLPALRDMKVSVGGQVQTLGLIGHSPVAWTSSDYVLALVVGALLGGGILLLCSIFIAYNITQFISGRRELAKRTRITLVGLMIGSLFWSLIFGLPAKFVLESPNESHISPFMFDCYAVLIIILIGAPIAVLFGLLIQLIWEDASLTEPLGEPL